MKKIKTSIILLLFISIYCCKKDSDNHPVKKLENIDLKESNYLNFYFPDTVNIKNVYEGRIEYKSDLDSITRSLYIKGDTTRMLTFYVKDNIRLIDDEYEHIMKSSVTDTFFPLNQEHKIIFTHKFNKLGINYLECVLEDEVYLFPKDSTDDIRIIKKLNHITLPVFVTDKDYIIDSYYENEKSNAEMREIKI